MMWVGACCARLDLHASFSLQTRRCSPAPFVQGTGVSFLGGTNSGLDRGPLEQALTQSGEVDAPARGDLRQQAGPRLPRHRVALHKVDFSRGREEDLRGGAATAPEGAVGPEAHLVHA